MHAPTVRIVRGLDSARCRHQQEEQMPERQTIERARRDKREGKSPSTQAGEFVREEIHHVREGKHGAQSTKQAIAIGLSKARRAGVRLPRRGQAAKTATKRSSTRGSSTRGGATRAGGRPSARRSKAVSKALRREGHSAASTRALARHARSAARKRTSAQRSASARKAARTKGPAVRKAAARQAARTRARNA